MPRPQSEKQRDVARTALQVDDDRGAITDAADIGGAVDGQGRCARAALGSKVSDDHASANATRVPERARALVIGENPESVAIRVHADFTNVSGLTRIVGAGLHPMRVTKLGTSVKSMQATQLAFERTRARHGTCLALHVVSPRGNYGKRNHPITRTFGQGCSCATGQG